MSLFGKTEIKSLAAIKGLAADAVTVEHVNAINAEFAELGFGGIEVAINGTLAEAATQINTAEDTIATHEATIAERDTRITELETENAELAIIAKDPADEASASGTAEDKIETVAVEDHNKLANDISAQIRAEKGL
jgi:hypothetical protein